MVTEEVVISKNSVDEDIKNFVDRLRTHKPDALNLNFFNIFDFFSYKEINEIFIKDEDITKLYEKALQSQEEFIDKLEMIKG